jgi:hypothetical protein
MEAVARTAKTRRRTRARMVDVGLGAGLRYLLIKRVGQADDLLRRHMIAWSTKFGITSP